MHLKRGIVELISLCINLPNINQICFVYLLCLLQITEVLRCTFTSGNSNSDLIDGKLIYPIHHHCFSTHGIDLQNFLFLTSGLQHLPCYTLFYFFALFLFKSNMSLFCASFRMTKLLMEVLLLFKNEGCMLGYTMACVTSRSHRWWF